MKLKDSLVVYLPDSRGVEISRYGRGNTKLGETVFSYSRSAGKAYSCPGSSVVCEEICYAKRIEGPVRTVYWKNDGDFVPPIPDECKLLRLHVSGDFDTTGYVLNWINLLTQRPDVTAWAYTRSWRVWSLLPTLEVLRALPNVQLFASVDSSTEMPPSGWRVARIEGDQRNFENPTIICPEEEGIVASCEACKYCFKGQKGDVTFLKH